jgi:uncharacterized protein
VLDQVENKREANVAVACVLSDLTVPSDIIVTTPDEIARRGHILGTVLRPALEEGKVIYDRPRAAA